MSGKTVTTNENGLFITDSLNPVTITSGVSIYAPVLDGPAVVNAPRVADLTVVNHGIVFANASDNDGPTFNGIGILATTDATVVNHSGAVISGYNAGISVTGTGTIINFGSIEQTGTTGPASSFSSDVFTAYAAGVIIGSGSVFNARSGVIATYLGGVAIGGGGTALNQGTITATGTSTSAGFGIVLTDGGSVTNAQGGLIDTGNDGVLAFAAPTTVANQGSIDGANFGVAVYTGASAAITNAAGGTISGGAGGIGFYASGAATVTNSGVIFGFDRIGVGIDVGSVTNTSGGFIYGGQNGVGAGNGSASTSPGSLLPASIDNDGTITGGHDTGVWLTSGGEVINHQTGTIFGHDYGVRLSYAAATVTNAGTIADGAAHKGAGVLLGADGFVTNSQSGYITSPLTGVDFGSSASAGMLENDGTIIGSDGIGSDGHHAGVGVAVHDNGVVINNADGTMIGGGIGVAAYSQVTLFNQGTIAGSDDAFDAVAGYADRVEVGPDAVFGGTVSGGNTLGSAVYSTLELIGGAGPGTLSGLNTQFVDFGQIQVDGHSNWTLGGTVSSLQTIAFNGAEASVTLLDPTANTVAVSGFIASDTIVLGGITDITGVSLSPGNVLTVTQAGGAPVYDFQFATANVFNYEVVGGSTEIVVPCFAAGTRIRTAKGSVAVEDLQVGTKVDALFAGTADVIWIGHRTVDCSRHPRPHQVWPIHIQAGAFGAAGPQTDLRVSPDHAIYINDVLIPARYLVNGTTIRQVPVDQVTYYHVELPRHDVLFAEGLTAESYLAIGDRSNFANGDDPMRLFADFSPPVADVAALWEAEGCAPMVIYGAELEAARRVVAHASQRLATHAAAGRRTKRQLLRTA